jgi:chemotaxis family two-component system sensor histidine kinase/response regulator PixL
MSRILVAEDDPDIRSLARLLLELSDHDVIEAADGEAVLSLLAADDDIDVVLLDLRLPLRNGFEVMTELRKTGRLGAKTRVVIFSAQIDPRDRERAEEQGASGFLAKPFSEEELLAAIQGS